MESNIRYLLKQTAYIAECVLQLQVIELGEF